MESENPPSAQPAPQPVPPPAAPFTPPLAPAAPGPRKPKKSPLKQRFPWHILALVVGAIALICGIILLVRSQQGVIEIVNIQPDYSITLNDQAISASHSPISLTKRPGTYRVIINRPHYQPFVQDVQVFKHSKTTVRPVFTLADKTSSPTSVTSVDYAQVSPDQKYVYFLGDNRQHLYRLDIENQTQAILTDRPLANVIDVEWSLNPDLALVVQTDGVYLQEIPKYDFKTQAMIKIGGPEIVSPVWDPTTNGSRMAFAYYPASGERSLVIADKRLTTMDRKADLSGLPDVKLRWSPDARYIALIGQSKDQSQNNIWIYTTADGSLRQITKQGYVNDVLFSRDGDTIAYHSLASGQSGIMVIRPDGSSVTSQPLLATLQNSTWNNNGYYLTANPSDKVISLYDFAKSKRKDLPCNFPNQDPIKGIFYFESNQNLVYYTGSGIYVSYLSE